MMTLMVERIPILDIEVVEVEKLQAHMFEVVSMPMLGRCIDTAETFTSRHT